MLLFLTILNIVCGIAGIIGFYYGFNPVCLFLSLLNFFVAGMLTAGIMLDYKE